VFEFQLYFRVSPHVEALYHVPQNPWIVIIFAAGSTHILPQDNGIFHIWLQHPPHMHAPNEFQ